MPRRLMRRLMRCLSLLAAVSWLAPGQASGQSCTLSATPLAFGTYAPLSGNAVTSTATISVRCTAGSLAALLSYDLSIGAGGGGSLAARSMAGSGPPLSYQVYTSVLYSQVWGDGTGGTGRVSDSMVLSSLASLTRSYPAYGRIPGGQRVGVGSFADTLIVTLSY